MAESEHEKLVSNDEKEDAGQVSIETETATPTPLSVKASLFGNKEGRITLAWLIYTFLYWTPLIWIPTIKDTNFTSGSFFLWCIGFIGLISCSYTWYEGKYPSGSTSTDSFETTSIGRYTAIFLTTTVIVDVIVLTWVFCINNYVIDALDATLLTCHCIHIFWASLFFYNKFYRYHSHMATRAFFIEWIDIIWTVMLSATLNSTALDTGKELNTVHYTYFSFITVSLVGWMLPMMLIKQWGAQEYASIVSLHLLVLDLVADVPVIIVVLSYEAYKENPILFVDVFWKSLIVVRSISYYIVNLMLYKTSDKEEEAKAVNKFDSGNVRKNKFRTTSSLLWIIYVAVYWTVATLVEVVSDNDIGTKYQYYTWVGGMIGVVCVYDTWLAGYHATTQRGRSMVAFACTFICTDWILRAFEILYWDEPNWHVKLVMSLHAIAVFWALIFFYGHAMNVGKTGGGWFNKAFISLVFEWIDILFMYAAVCVLHLTLGDCFSDGICLGYFVIAAIKLYAWFFPIMFRSADTEWRLHAHMVGLDTITDLPLIIIIFATEAYTIHWFIFLDVVYKLIMLLRTYAYHLVINLILKRVELNESHKMQLEEAHQDELEDEDIEVAAVKQ